MASKDQNRGQGKAPPGKPPTPEELKAWEELVAKNNQRKEKAKAIQGRFDSANKDNVAENIKALLALKLRESEILNEDGLKVIIEAVRAEIKLLIQKNQGRDQELKMLTEIETFFNNENAVRVRELVMQFYNKSENEREAKERQDQNQNVVDYIGQSPVEVLRELAGKDNNKKLGEIADKDGHNAGTKLRTQLETVVTSVDELLGYLKDPNKLRQLRAARKEDKMGADEHENLKRQLRERSDALEGLKQTKQAQASKVPKIREKIEKLGQQKADRIAELQRLKEELPDYKTLSSEQGVLDVKIKELEKRKRSLGVKLKSAAADDARIEARIKNIVTEIDKNRRDLADVEVQKKDIEDFFKNYKDLKDLHELMTLSRVFSGKFRKDKLWEQWDPQTKSRFAQLARTFISEKEYTVKDKDGRLIKFKGDSTYIEAVEAFLKNSKNWEANIGALDSFYNKTVGTLSNFDIYQCRHRDKIVKIGEIIKEYNSILRKEQDLNEKNGENIEELRKLKVKPKDIRDLADVEQDLAQARIAFESNKEKLVHYEEERKLNDELEAALRGEISSLDAETKQLQAQLSPDTALEEARAEIQGLERQIAEKGTQLGYTEESLYNNLTIGELIEIYEQAMEDARKYPEGSQFEQSGKRAGKVAGKIREFIAAQYANASEADKQRIQALLPPLSPKEDLLVRSLPASYASDIAYLLFDQLKKRMLPQTEVQPGEADKFFRGEKAGSETASAATSTGLLSRLDELIRNRAAKDQLGDPKHHLTLDVDKLTPSEDEALLDIIEAVRNEVPLAKAGEAKAIDERNKIAHAELDKIAQQINEKRAKAAQGSVVDRKPGAEAAAAAATVTKPTGPAESPELEIGQTLAERQSTERFKAQFRLRVAEQHALKLLRQCVAPDVGLEDVTIGILNFKKGQGAIINRLNLFYSEIAKDIMGDLQKFHQSEKKGGKSQDKSKLKHELMGKIQEELRRLEPDLRDMLVEDERVLEGPKILQELQNELGKDLNAIIDKIDEPTFEIDTSPARDRKDRAKLEEWRELKRTALLDMEAKKRAELLAKLIAATAPEQKELLDRYMAELDKRQNALDAEQEKSRELRERLAEGDINISRANERASKAETMASGLAGELRDVYDKLEKAQQQLEQAKREQAQQQSAAKKSPSVLGKLAELVTSGSKERKVDAEPQGQQGTPGAPPAGIAGAQPTGLGWEDEGRLRAGSGTHMGVLQYEERIAELNKLIAKQQRQIEMLEAIRREKEKDAKKIQELEARVKEAESAFHEEQRAGKQAGKEHASVLQQAVDLQKAAEAAAAASAAELAAAKQGQAEAVAALNGAKAEAGKAAVGLAEANRRNEQLQQQLQQQEQDRKRAEEATAKKEAELAAALAANAGLQGQVTEAMQRAAKAGELADGVSRQLEEQQAANEQLKQENGAQGGENKQLTERVAALTEQLAAANKAIQKAEQDARAAVDRVKELEQQLQQQAKAMAELQAKLTAQGEATRAAQTAMAALQQQLKELEAQNKDLGQNLQSRDPARNPGAAKVVEQLQEQQEASAQQLEAEQKARAQAKEDFDKRLQELQAQNAALLQALQEEGAPNKDANLVAQRLREQLRAQQEAQEAALEEAKRRAELRILELEGAKQGIEEDLLELQKRNKQRDVKDAAEDKRIAELEASNERLTRELSQATQELRSLRTDNTALREENERLKNALRRYNIDLRTLQPLPGSGMVPGARYEPITPAPPGLEGYPPEGARHAEFPEIPAEGPAAHIKLGPQSAVNVDATQKSATRAGGKDGVSFSARAEKVGLKSQKTKSLDHPILSPDGMKAFAQKIQGKIDSVNKGKGLLDDASPKREQDDLMKKFEKWKEKDQAKRAGVKFEDWYQMKVGKQKVYSGLQVKQSSSGAFSIHDNVQKRDIVRAEPKKDEIEIQLLDHSPKSIMAFLETIRVACSASGHWGDIPLDNFQPPASYFIQTFAEKMKLNIKFDPASQRELDQFKLNPQNISKLGLGSQSSLRKTLGVEGDYDKPSPH